MTPRVLLRVLAVLAAPLVACGTVAAQEKSPDQVGLVFPAFFNADDTPPASLGQSVAYALKLTVQSYLSSEDPTRIGVPQSGYGRGITYYVPATMEEASHDAAARLARINGLQGTVWGITTPLIDGIAIQPFLTLAKPYEDFRDTRQEIWQVEVGGDTFRLGPPQHAVAFLSETVPASFVAQFGDPAAIDYCPEDGSCVRFPDAQVSRVWSVRDDGRALIRRGGMDYEVQLPKSEIYTSEVVDYTNLFIAYARGNLNQAIAFADIYLERHGASGTAIDAHLYKAAAMARTGRTEEAAAEIQTALELNPVARRTLRYGIMLELLRTAGPTEQSDEFYQTIVTNYGLTDPFDESYQRLR